MNVYKIKYANGDYEIVAANTSLEVIKKYDLATAKHISTRIEQLEGAQAAACMNIWNEQHALLINKRIRK